ncbi:DUF2157 domain-containing protein [Pseudomonas sp. 5P_3.1_Bac2]|uniref:DUF2157 domain-containing protein n=1 Tax=Pseudomonas sp. 5P_3.1_Bac2 TaxID=2971617 RepID=UPI0021C7E7F4|nr:DUF2157 domain-containing protein [Pseudomonas sp. 5P_3.1_Bac2]MCU1716990.1 DUF2157 domain-containing protein [Pseudomonas sp. 5P_3.1_Bac2]
MPTLNRTDAQRRADEISIFNRELARLEEARVLQLSTEQRGSIHQYQQQLLDGFLSAFDIDYNRQTQQLSIGMRVASLIGALAMAASLFFLFYQFWDQLSTTLQVTVLAGSSLATCALTFFLQRRDRSGYFSKLAALVAFTSLLLNVLLLADMFNLQPSGKAFAPWSLYGLLLAYACNSRLLLVLGLGCGAVFVASWLGSLGGASWDAFVERPETFLLPCVVIFLLSLRNRQLRFDGFNQIYRLVGTVGVLLCLLGLGYWGEASYLSFSTSRIEGFYQLLGFVVASGLLVLGTRCNWPEVLNSTLAFFILFMGLKMFDWFWEVLPDYLFFLLLGLLAIAALLLLRRMRRVQAWRQGEVRP